MNQTRWKTLARSLKIGQTIKTPHCGIDRSALVSHNERGYSIYCFRCGSREYEPHGKRSLHEILESRRAEEALQAQGERIPEHATTCEHWPHQVAGWVLMCNLPLETACYEYGFRYDPQSRRLLIPLIGQPGFLGRATHGERPKWRLYGTGDRYALLSGHQETIVCVEDALSAIAVNRAGWPALAVLGTSITPSHAEMMAKPDVVGWFDDDTAGNIAWVKLRRRMSLWPCSLRRIITNRDPKHIHRAEIVARLEGTYD